MNSLLRPPQSPTMQSLAGNIGEHLAMRSCSPVAFYTLLDLAGYIRSGHPSLADFYEGLGGDQLTTEAADWSRPALSARIREQFGATIISWQLTGDNNVDEMRAAGYISTPLEEAFYLGRVQGRSLESVVRDGYPVIVTMQPGFSSPDNGNIHTALIMNWSDEQVVVFDPDERNTQTEFSPDYVRSMISPVGAGTIILPAS